MATVETVLGRRDVQSLGATLMHEHVFIIDQELDANYLHSFNAEVEVERAAVKLEDAARRGVGTIVDMTVLGLGRYIPLVQEVARRTSVNIVAATGVYTWNDIPMYFRLRGPGLLIDDKPNVMADLFVRDIIDGIGDTGVKAAVLKFATDHPGVTDGVEQVIRAVALAHLATGVPISTHSHAVTRRGLEQQEILRDEGVDLRNVVIGHSGDCTDLDYLKELMDAGSYIGMDRFGNNFVLPLSERIATVSALCAQGYADRMVLSHDSACFSHAFPNEDKQQLVPHWNYCYLHDTALPLLANAGVSQHQIHQMMVTNPAEILGS